MAALVISAFFAGLTGGAFAYHDVSYYLYRPFSPLWTFDPLLAVFIGGVGTVVGPVYGAFFYVVVSELLAQQLVELHLIVFGVLFILVVLLLPGGLVEAWHRLRRLLSPACCRRALSTERPNVRRTLTGGRLTDAPQSRRSSHAPDPDAA